MVTTMTGRVVYLVSILAACCMMFAEYGYAAGPTPATTTVALTASVGESITLSATPNSLTVPTDASTYSSPIAVSYSWNLNPTANYTLQFAAGFASATSAMTNGSTVITAAQMYSHDVFTSTWTPTGNGGGFCGNQPPKTPITIAANATCFALTSPVGQHGTGSDSGTTISMNMSGGLVSLTAGTYTGTLNLEFATF